MEKGKKLFYIVDFVLSYFKIYGFVNFEKVNNDH